jgi:hypothetical protein
MVILYGAYDCFNHINEKIFGCDSYRKIFHFLQTNYTNFKRKFLFLDS